MLAISGKEESLYKFLLPWDNNTVPRASSGMLKLPSSRRAPAGTWTCFDWLSLAEELFSINFSSFVICLLSLISIIQGEAGQQVNNGLEPLALSSSPSRVLGEAIGR